MSYTLMEGKSHRIGSEAETVSMIRTVLDDETSDQTGRAGTAPGQGRTKSKAHLFSPLKDEEASPETAEKKSVVRAVLAAIGYVFQRARARTKRKHIVLAAVLLLLVVRPLWVISAAVLVVLGIALLFALSGPEKFWRGVVLGLERTAEKDPARGTYLRAKLDAFAMRWDTFLDWFPDGSVDALYMPDLQELGDDNRDQAERLEARLRRLKQEASGAGEP